MDSSESRAAARRASWHGYIARSAAEADQYQRQMEAAIPPQERVEAIWELVIQSPWGKDAAEHGFDRSSARVERRRR